MGHTGFCQTCKSKRFHAHRRIEREGLIVDQAGGAWWVWDRNGEVLVIGKPTRDDAITALALGDEVDDEEDEELEEGRRKAIDVAIQKAIDHPRCPDCGNTDVTTGRGPEDLACPKCGQQWEPSHADSMAHLRRITSTSNPLFGELSPGETIAALVGGTAVLVGLTLILLRVVAPAPVASPSSQ